MTQKAKAGSQAAPILVPVDFSEHSRAALLWAWQQARLTGAPLVALHVVHDPANAPGYYQRSKDDLLQPMEDVAAKMMRRFIKGARKQAGLKKPAKGLRTKLVVGLPVTRILEVARQVGAGQIVMGSQGRTGLERLLLGSKAEQVVRMAEVPVTIVKTARQ